MSKSEPSWATDHLSEENEWARWSSDPLQQIDLAVHTHYLKQFLSRNDRVLEVGAGAGLFTREIAALVDRVTVVDISEEKLRRNQRNAEVLGYAHAIEKWCQADMRDLARNFAEGEFDAVVCFGGPLSYITDAREKVLRELVYVTRHGGLLLLSARSLWGTLHENLPRIINTVDPHITREILKTGDLGPSQIGPVNRFWHAYRSHEFKELIESAGCEVLLLSASNCLTSTWGQVLAAWRDDEKLWHHIVELEIEACRQPGCLDLGSHILAVARKR